MTTVVDRYKKKSRRRRRRVEAKHQRLDIQGLRMVAVLTVFANHLWGQPRGGFVGVDVFFVISGFLITGNLLRSAEKTGRVSFRHFYWNRVRRIVPAATLVLLLTYAASLLVFLPSRSHQIGVDALMAFVFLANWHFAREGTDYFAGGLAVSPLQHYWSLSIEEQFYFVWPAVIFTIGVLVVRKGWTHTRRMQMAAGFMAVIVAMSLAWALHETATAPTWAYFNTFSRVWELGVGALMATAVGQLSRIPDGLRSWLSWAGLGLVAATLYLIGDGASGFPAPWALLPVTGAALVIAAGVGKEPRHQGLLRNAASVYVGNISYSLYLVHWPIIVIFGSITPYRGVAYYAAVIGLAFGAAVTSYHLVENPLRYASFRRNTRSRDMRVARPAVAAGFALMTVGLVAYTLIPPVQHNVPPLAITDAGQSPQQAKDGPDLGPLQTELQNQIGAALQATEWPQLETMAANIKEPFGPEIAQCGHDERGAASDDRQCTWGDAAAPIHVMLVGDSVAMAYAVSLRDMVLRSNGRVQMRLEALSACRMITALPPGKDDGADSDEVFVDACVARRQHTIQMINEIKPDVLIVSNAYNDILSNGGPSFWANDRRQIVDQFKDNVKEIVWLAAPPDDKDINACYIASSVPADCVSTVTSRWIATSKAEQAVAKQYNGVWVDSRQWFCQRALCPAFVGSTPVKLDVRHMTVGYATKISPAMSEAFAAAGVF